MTTFEFDITKKEQDGGDAIHDANNFIINHFSIRMREKKMTKAKLAKILELDKSTISRLFRGNKNFTMRTFGEICGALDYKLVFESKDLLSNYQNSTPKNITGNGGKGVQNCVPKHNTVQNSNHKNISMTKNGR